MEDLHSVDINDLEEMEEIICPGNGTIGCCNNI